MEKRLRSGSAARGAKAKKQASKHSNKGLTVCLSHTKQLQKFKTCPFVPGDLHPISSHEVIPFPILLGIFLQWQAVPPCTNDGQHTQRHPNRRHLQAKALSVNGYAPRVCPGLSRLTPAADALMRRSESEVGGFDFK